jgi:hypothetical protein
MRTPAELMAATQMHFAQLRAGGLLPNHPAAGMQLANMQNLLAGQQASQQPKTQSAEHKKKLLWSGKKTETAQVRASLSVSLFLGHPLGTRLCFVRASGLIHYSPFTLLGHFGNGHDVGER